MRATMMTPMTMMTAMIQATTPTAITVIVLSAQQKKKLYFAKRIAEVT